MDWIHQNISPLAGPHPTVIPDVAEGNLLTGEGITSAEHHVLGLLWFLSKHLDATHPSGNSGSTPASVAPVGANSAEIENLTLLYSSGFIQEEEYRRRLAELNPSSGGAEGPEWEGHNSFACTCPRETCSMCYQKIRSCTIDEHRESICPKRLMKCAYCQEISLPFEGTARLDPD